MRRSSKKLVTACFEKYIGRHGIQSVGIDTYHMIHIYSSGKIPISTKKEIKKTPQKAVSRLFFIENVKLQQPIERFWRQYFWRQLYVCPILCIVNIYHKMLICRCYEGRQSNTLL